MLLETQTLLTITLLSRYTLGLYQVKKCYQKRKKKREKKKKEKKVCKHEWAEHFRWRMLKHIPLNTKPRRLMASC